MQLGIIGAPLAGKTTVFELLSETELALRGGQKANLATIRIPDQRIDHLSAVYKPKKTTYAQLEIVDIPGISDSDRKSGNVFLENVRKADALLLVIRGFSDLSGLESTPLSDLENLSYELLLSDLDLIEKRLERIAASKKKNTLQEELTLLTRLKEALTAEQPLSSVEMSPEEQKELSSYQFLTMKPLLVCLNLSEAYLAAGAYPGREEVFAYCAVHALPVVELSADMEKEITTLPAEEREEFLKELGLKESGLTRVARGLYERLALLSFFTVGEDEVRAWTIHQDTPAKNAAGKIHSDIERGFIRAEVFAYDDFVAQASSVAALKEKGLLRLEGKEYIIRDGDIVHFRFNI
jgi:GTP-binding protein YchF